MKQKATLILSGFFFLQSAIFNLEIVAQVPVANFTADTTSGCAPLTVTFTDLSTNTPTSWFWDFGNGDTSTLQNPVEVYNTVGSYTVLLVATNSSGSDSLMITTYINVTDSVAPAQPGSITGSNSACEGESVTYSISAVSGATSYTWTVPSGWTINSGQGTTSITVMVGNNSGDVCVSACNACGCSSYTCLSITASQVLNVTDSITAPTCANNNGTACVSVTGGTTPYTVLWNDSNNTLGACADSIYAGVLNPMITDSNGCSITIPIAISDIVGASIDSIVPTNVICAGDSNATAQVFISGGTSPFTYIWKDNFGTTIGFNSNFIFNLYGGIFSATVIDNNSCSSSDTFIVQEPLQLTSQITDSVMACPGICNGQATVTVAGGTLPYSYSWTNTQTTSTSTGLCGASTHNVIITDFNGCQSVSSVNITELNSFTINLSPDMTLCFADTIVLFAGSGYASYLWSDSTTNEDLWVFTSGTYYVEVTDSSGCTASDTVNITVTSPSATISSSDSDLSICSGDSVTFTITPAGSPDYAFFINSTLVQSDSNNIYGTSGLIDGDTITASSCGYFVNDTLIFSVSPQLLATSVATPSTCGSANGQATATPSGGTSPYTYLWDDPLSQTTPTAISLVTGTYTITITDNFGCSIILSNIIVADMAAPAIDSIVLTDVLCNGDASGSATAYVSGGTMLITYLWSDALNQTTPTASQLQAGVYNVIVTDANGCTASYFILISQPDLLITITLGDDTICLGDSAIISAVVTGGFSPYSYTWLDGFTGGGPFVVSPTTTKSYSVYVTDGNGCVSSMDSVTIYVMPTGQLAGIITTKNTGVPLENSRIYLIKYDASDSSLTAIDTTYTDTTGYYEFNNLDSTIYVKAIPDSANYPNHVPSYYNSKLVFQAAIPINFSGCDSLNGDFNVLPGKNPGGSGFIGGHIKQGAGKKAGIGDPIVNLNLVLMDGNLDPVTYTSTDTNGYFSFANIALDNYSIWVDKPFIDTNLAPLVVIDATTPVRDSLTFDLHTTWLELVTSVGVKELGNHNRFRIYPNPNKGTFTLEFSLVQPESEIIISDVLGREIYKSRISDQKSSISIQSYPKGIYFINVLNENGIFVAKIIHQ